MQPVNNVQRMASPLGSPMVPLRSQPIMRHASIPIQSVAMPARRFSTPAMSLGGAVPFGAVPFQQAGPATVMAPPVGITKAAPSSEEAT
jgi:hypothetical protein